ncbi:MAG TPA: HEPN domain-containing protein [Candidatus Gastranaerophilales bacterium]|nr:HEPN domain-containing protein [Candidatus Gastranaerophilales bacterium]
MENHNKTLAQVAIEKSDKAIRDADVNIDVSLPVAQNRAYYAVFYIVLALSYLDNFITKSHHKLMGQFNKKYVYQNRIFDKSLVQIYNTLIINRESSDYNLTYKQNKEEVLWGIESAKKFINTVKPYVIKRINELEK